MILKRGRQRMTEKESKIFSEYGFKISPSKISKFFSYNCNRQFIFNNFTRINAEGIPKDIPSKKGTENSITSEKKIGSDGFSAYVGNEWEKIIVSKLIKNKNIAVFDCYEKPDFSLIDIITNYCDSELKVPMYIYQSSFSVSEDSFLGIVSDAISQYKQKKDNIFSLTWSQVRPDLLVLEKDENGDVLVNVCDVKYARKAHLSHKFQVALYIMLMVQYMKEQCGSEASLWSTSGQSQSEFISPKGVKLCINNETGYVFSNRNEKKLSDEASLGFENMTYEELKNQMESFDTNTVSTFINDLFGERICEILSEASEIVNGYNGDADDIDEIKRHIGSNMTFCIGSNCDGCGYIENRQNVELCIELGEKEKSVQLYPNMSRRAQMFIKRLAKKYPELNLLSYEGIQALRYTGTKIERACINEMKGSISWSKYTNRLNKDNFCKLFFERKNGISPSVRIQNSPMEDYNQYLATGGDNIRENAFTNKKGKSEVEIISRVKELSMQIPVDQDIAVFMDINTGIDEDGNNICYSYAINIVINEERKSNNSWLMEFEESHLSHGCVSKKFSDEERLGEKFIDEVYSIIFDVSSYNSGRTEGQKLTLQAYVFDSKEYNTIYDYLIRKYQEIQRDSQFDLDMREQLEKIEAILFWIQGDQIITNLAEHPYHVFDIPIAIILDELKKLYEIPAYVVTNLWNIIACIDDRNLEMTRYLFDAKKYFGYVLSDDIDIRKIYDDEGKLREDKNLEDYMLNRLIAQGLIITWMQNDKEQKKKLICRLVPFNRPTALQVNPYISKLVFEAMNEFYLDYCQKKSTIMRNPASVIAANQEMVVIMTAHEKKKGKRRYTAKIDKDVYTKKMFEAYLIINENNRQQLAQTLSFDSLMNDMPNGNVFVISNIWFSENTDAYGNRDIMTFECPSENNNPAITRKLEELVREKKECFIIEKPTAYTTVMLRSALYGLSTNEDVMKLFEPTMIYKASEELEMDGIDWIRPIRMRAENPEYSKINGNDFVDTQELAFNQLCLNNITLLQGPPGTGKTDYIGRSVATLVKSKLEEGTSSKFRILVSGFTHTSINNALRKIYDTLVSAGLIYEFTDENGVIMDTVKMFKDKGADNKKSQIDGINSIIDLPSDPQEWNEQVVLEASEREEIRKSVIQIVGATCWACCKTNGKINPNGINADFDLIIIDEASQLTVAQALTVMSYGKTDTTHYLIVGDNHQLPPIIRGDYSVIDGEKNIYGSIFDFYYEESKKLASDRSYLFSLSTEFRMNEALCAYSAKKIYNPQFIRNQRYTAYDFHNNPGVTNELAIKNQKLEYVDGWRDIVTDEWAREILDNDYPLTVIYLSGDDAIKKNETEVSIVVSLTDYLQNILVDKNGKKYFDVYEEELPKVETGIGLPISIARFWGTELQKAHIKYVNEHHDMVTIPDTAAFGILAPHHKHIHNITSKIQEGYTAKYPEECNTHYSRSKPYNNGTATVSRGRLLIDTVNKLQGQEREAVIMSYGVYDVEKAIAVGDFFYSYQRLNVALTRGKKKTILILTDTLSDKPIELLESSDDNLIKGISFLCDLDEYMKEESEDSENAEWSGSVDGVKMTVYKKKWVNC